ncbi:NAD(P)/FAD-dependent oxidoreductase [Trichothermofontia sp.]
MSHVVIVGCGIIGATIAYELSRVSDLIITVLEQQPEATFFPTAGSPLGLPNAPSLRPVASHAALGILVGVSSQKRKGRAWNLRQVSIRRYHSLLSELTALTGQAIAHNPQGLLHLLTADVHLDDWQQLCDYRTDQGFSLDWLSPAALRERYPDLGLRDVVAGVHSPQDLHFQPASLLRALITAARRQGVQFHFATSVLAFSPLQSEKATATPSPKQPVTTVYTQTETLTADWIILAAGLGSTPLTTALQSPVALMPVLGQGIQARLNSSLVGQVALPVITQNDIHIAPLDHRDYWIGATVEFPQGEMPLRPDRAQLQTVWERAIAILPALRDATWVETWYGLRPRPVNQPAPMIEKLAGYSNVILATGHYRNGILLAPATAQGVSALMGVSLPAPNG